VFKRIEALVWSPDLGHFEYVDEKSPDSRQLYDSLET